MPRIRRAALPAAALALFATACQHGTPTPGADGAALPASPEAIRAHVSFLADDTLEGRLAGTRGYDIAARYVASEYAQLGLKPAGDADTAFQRVPLVESVALLPAARLTLLPDSGAPVALEAGKDFLPDASLVDAEVQASAPVVFVSFGVSAPEQGHDDLAGIDLTGKVALVFGGAPASFPPAIRAHHSSRLTKNAVLAARGAVGVIGLQTREEQERTPWARLVQQSWRSRMGWVGADGAVNGAWPQLKIRASINPESAAAFFAGAPITLEQAYDAAAAGKPQAFELPLSVDQLRKSIIRQRASDNVVAVLEGSDPALKGEYIAISAHLDHVGKGAPVGGDAIYNGAFDNAVGIGIMLETARLLATAPRRPRRSVLFVAVTAEESGLQGSDFFVQHPTVPRGSIVANINMDMPVALAPLADVTAFGAEHSSLGAVAERAAKAEGIGLAPDEKPEEVFFVRSDQYSFVRAGIPALYIDQGMTSSDPAIDQKGPYEAFLKDKYHQPGDDLSQAIHWPSLAMLARLNTRIIADVADAKARPAWNPGNFFGETFAASAGAAATD
jgi:Zn-dependent M28 family amino/carboxypeptidase